MARRALSTACGLVAAVLCAGMADAQPLSRATVENINYSVNAAFRHCPQWSCTSDFHPAMVGDCKQAAAEKLRRLILAGADPKDFSIWVVEVPRGLHAVLVQNGTAMVLDLIVNPIESMPFKEKYEGMIFRERCDDCGGAARLSAALTLQRRQTAASGAR